MPTMQNYRYPFTLSLHLNGEADSGNSRNGKPCWQSQSYITILFWEGYELDDLPNHPRVPFVIDKFRDEIISLVPFEGCVIPVTIVENWFDCVLTELGL